MLRYIRRLEAKDLSLTTSMIPLGSCTMKLNATSEMLPVTWPEFGKLHPFAPAEQTAGYAEMCAQLEAWLAEITGFAGVSLEPNAGSQGEYAGLLVDSQVSRVARRRAPQRLPHPHVSAHGTNPASAVMAGMKVVAVACLTDGDIDLADLRAKAEAARGRSRRAHGHVSEHARRLRGNDRGDLRDHSRARRTGLHGRREHERAGRPHLAGPHRRGCLPPQSAQDLLHSARRRRPGHGADRRGGASRAVPSAQANASASGHRNTASIGAISAAPFGSASILTIPWMYIRMMGGEGLTEATKLAILNANYIARRLDPYFPVLFKGRDGLVAHECILDLRGFKHDHRRRRGQAADGLRLPRADAELAGRRHAHDRADRERIEGRARPLLRRDDRHPRRDDRRRERRRPTAQDNPLKNAPHTAHVVTASEWTHPYSREQAAYPAPWLREHKFWPTVGRIDNVWGDRNLFCACVPADV